MRTDRSGVSAAGSRRDRNGRRGSRDDDRTAGLRASARTSETYSRLQQPHEPTQVRTRERRVRVERQRRFELAPRFLVETSGREQRAARVVRGRRTRRVEDGSRAVAHAELRESPVAPDPGPRVIRGGVPRVQPRGGAQVIERGVQDPEAPVLVGHGSVVLRGDRDQRQRASSAAAQRRIVRLTPWPPMRPLDEQPRLERRAARLGRDRIRTSPLPERTRAATVADEQPSPRLNLRCAAGCAAAP